MKKLFLILIIFNMICITAHAKERDYTTAVIHHTASPDWPVERIKQIHIKERGWQDVGYHYVIRKNGTIQKGRNINWQGAHAIGRNHYTGIALTGYDEFSNEQINALTKLLQELKIKNIERHHEECPGKGLNLNKIRRSLQK